MAEGVVDDFEVVQIHEQQSQLSAATLRVRQRQLQVFIKQRAVGQHSQLVVGGEKFHAPAGFFDEGDIAEHAYVIDDMAIFVAHGID